ncbi:MAG: hypothetical protein ABI151_17100 [Chitinophagaceae bacterium]
MVNIIENRAIVTGTVIFLTIDPDIKGFFTVSFKLLKSSDLDDLPNLARPDEGRQINIRMSKNFIDENNIAPGANISIPVRKAFGQVYFSLEP